jgi:hypothetical protein
MGSYPPAKASPEPPRSGAGSAPEKDPLPPEVRWGLGILVSSAAVVGILILVFLVAIALTPPTWVQVVLGVGLAVGGALFAWLIAHALGQRKP